LDETRRIPDEAPERGVESRSATKIREVLGGQVVQKLQLK